LRDNFIALCWQGRQLSNPAQSVATKPWRLPRNCFWVKSEDLRVEFDNVLNRMRVCGCDHVDSDPYHVSGLDPNNTNFNFGIVSPGTACQGNTPRRGQAVLRITFWDKMIETILRNDRDTYLTTSSRGYQRTEALFLAHNGQSRSNHPWTKGRS
jgi:hypothetical protein